MNLPPLNKKESYMKFLTILMTLGLILVLATTINARSLNSTYQTVAQSQATIISPNFDKLSVDVFQNWEQYRNTTNITGMLDQLKIDNNPIIGDLMKKIQDMNKELNVNSTPVDPRGNIAL
jgi:hypothetical protein